MDRHYFTLDGGIRCPCVKCKCEKILKPIYVRAHLLKFGFMPDYYIWVSHEEERSNVPNLGYASSSYKNITYVDQFSSMTEMAYDAHMQPCDMVPFDAIYEEDPNEEAKKFYETLAAGNQPIYEAATKSRLSIAIRLLAARTSCRATEKSINYFIQ